MRAPHLVSSPGPAGTASLVSVSKLLESIESFVISKKAI
jgi:hypothetical protein